jgi:hypothetical protein
MFFQIASDQQGLQGLQGWPVGQVQVQVLAFSQLNYRKLALILQWERMIWMIECPRDMKERHFDYQRGDRKIW